MFDRYYCQLLFVGAFERKIDGHMYKSKLQALAAYRCVYLRAPVDSIQKFSH
jgi:hypothetical protein